MNVRFRWDSFEIELKADGDTLMYLAAVSTLVSEIIKGVPVF